jgi:hypothetical protein
MNGLTNGLYDGLLTGQGNGLFDGLNNGLNNGLFNNDSANDYNALSFINAVGTLTSREANAINVLVYQLKYYKIWNKCVAIYPFIGGTASTHKFNLLSPLDSNAAYRLTFSGGWTHSSTGALPNGTNAFANTNLIPNNFFRNYNSLHLSFYSRTNSITLTGRVDIGSQSAANRSLLMAYGSYNQTYYYSGDNLLNFAVQNPGVADTRGLLIGTTTAYNRLQLFNNGRLIASDNDVISASLPTLNIWIGANSNSGGVEWGNKECAFASIGYSLNNYECIILYQIVQNYQSLLGRQV